MKELYLEIVEELTAELEALGLTFEAAYELASTEAWDVLKDRLADQIDQARQLHKDRIIDERTV